jgi:enoyl-[acyl-carrier protein] reductase I
VGDACFFLASPYGTAMTGETWYIDGGYHILG